MFQFRQTILCGAVAMALISATGCAYMHVQSPLSTNFKKTDLGTKTGRASSYSLVWLVSWGDAGTKAAAKNGGIQFVECEDIETKIVLFGLYTRITTVAYGE